MPLQLWDLLLKTNISHKWVKMWSKTLPQDGFWQKWSLGGLKTLVNKTSERSLTLSIVALLCGQCALDHNPDISQRCQSMLSSSTVSVLTHQNSSSVRSHLKKAVLKKIKWWWCMLHTHWRAFKTNKRFCWLSGTNFAKIIATRHVSKTTDTHTKRQTDR